MQALTLHFDFTDAPLPDDPDMFRFRRTLSRILGAALAASGGGRWHGGRYARGVVTIFLAVPDRPAALAQVRAVLASRGLLERMTASLPSE